MVEDLLTACLFTLYFGTLVLFSYLMFVADTEGKGLNGSVSRFLLQKAPSVFRNCFLSLFGERIYYVCGGCYNYVVNQRNPLLQLAYLVILNGAYIAWLVFGQPLLPTYLCRDFHKYGGFIGIIICHISFVAACRVGPGTITAGNVSSFKHHPYDEIIFSRGLVCSTCNVDKV